MTHCRLLRLFRCPPQPPTPDRNIAKAWNTNQTVWRGDQYQREEEDTNGQ